MRVPTAPQYRTGTASLDLRYRRRMDMIPLDIVHAHSPFGAGREALPFQGAWHPLVASFHSKYYMISISITLLIPWPRWWWPMLCVFIANVTRSGRSVKRLPGAGKLGYEGPIRVVPTKPPCAWQVMKLRLVEERFQLGKAIALVRGANQLERSLACVLDAAALLAKQGRRLLRC